MLKLLITVLLFFGSIYLSVGQNSTGTINVIGGSSVHLIVNSLKKYEEGVTLEGWSRIRLRFNELVPLTTVGWQLNIKAQTPDIISDSGGDNLSLSTLEIRAINVEVVKGSYTGTAVPSTIVLNSGYVELLTDNQINDIELIVTISYDLGTKDTNKLLGSEPGYFFVDLEFQLLSIDI